MHRAGHSFGIHRNFWPCIELGAWCEESTDLFQWLALVAFAAAATVPAFAAPTNTFASRTVEDDSLYAREYDSDLWVRSDWLKPRDDPKSRPIPPQKPYPSYPPPPPPNGRRHRRNLDEDLWARDGPKPPVRSSRHTRRTHPHPRPPRDTAAGGVWMRTFGRVGRLMSSIEGIESIVPLLWLLKVVLHPEDTDLVVPTTVQVTVKADGRTSTDALAAFFYAQREVSDIVTRIVTAHLHNRLPSPMFLEGDGYVLTAKHTAWTFGNERVKFSWGTEEIQPGIDKWTFLFASIKQDSEY
ncbi:uncharacterized protein B0H18DRAFT_1115195 [Fomitopsis serialis]|uniref:uncharacterized protein n=1 Tax=Fomitopsis serialis TaxID=139415 RepID=UPI002007C857|nr:uncharacterized protein B0H18DRAFT_1115195 [Neoantrodia serialis]KAH9933828.1 hypothetical protein B0H18DRAFT_1115195 [Neoantrodia serialis]